MYEKEFAENQVVLCVISEDNYQAKRRQILEGLFATSKFICYVLYTKPYTSVKQELKSWGFDKIFYVDTLTMSVQQPPKVDDCIFVQAPTSLIDVSVAVSKAITDKEKASVLIDSLSSLLVYQDSHTVTKFLHNLINKIRVSNSKMVLLVLKKDSESELVKDLAMFVDKVME
jgi:hypothetical protein